MQVIQVSHMQTPFEHIKHKIMNAQINQYPYPHISINEIFPPEFYKQILENIPETSLYTLNQNIQEDGQKLWII